MRNSYAKAAGADLPAITSDLQEQLAEHARRTLERHHGGKPMDWGEAATLEFAERFKPLAGCMNEVAYCVADQLCPPGARWKPRDGARVRAVHLIAEHLGCSPSTANNAMQAAELGRRLDVEKLGTPNVQQLMAIVWTHVKARGWDRVNGWMIRNKFTFENTTPDDLKDYCEEIKAADKAHERERDAALLPADPHDPPDAVVVEEVDGVPVASTPSKAAQTEEWRAQSRKFKALAEVDDLIEKAGHVVNLDEIPDGDEELLKRIGDIDRLADLAARLRAKAMPCREDVELPL